MSPVEQGAALSAGAAGRLASAPPQPLQRRTPRVALLGAPNAGKSTVFNRLTGLRQRIANYPGITVEERVGTAFLGSRIVEVVDLPGAYRLGPGDGEEGGVFAALTGADGRPPIDLLVCLLDATQLERNLSLALEAAEFGVPMVVVVNQWDLAEGGVDGRRESPRRRARCPCGQADRPPRPWVGRTGRGAPGGSGGAGASPDPFLAEAGGGGARGPAGSVPASWAGSGSRGPAGDHLPGSPSAGSDGGGGLGTGARGHPGRPPPGGPQPRPVSSPGPPPPGGCHARRDHPTAATPRKQSLGVDRPGASASFLGHSPSDRGSLAGLPGRLQRVRPPDGGARDRHGGGAGRGRIVFGKLAGPPQFGGRWGPRGRRGCSRLPAPDFPSFPLPSGSSMRRVISPGRPSSWTDCSGGAG